MYGTGISNTSCVLDLAVENGFVQKGGSWYSYNDEKIGQGKDRTVDYLINHPEVLAELDAKVREKYGMN